MTELIFADERGEPVDAARFDATVAAAVEDAVARQRAAGIDIVSDGEMSKISYATYIKDPISGFDGDTPRSPPAIWRRIRAICGGSRRRAAPPPTAGPGA